MTNKNNIRYVICLGENEINDKVINIKDMNNSTNVQVNYDDIDIIVDMLKLCTSRDYDIEKIKDELTKQGFKIEKSAIKLNNTIASLGFHNVDLELYNDVIASVKVHVIK